VTLWLHREKARDEAAAGTPAPDEDRDRGEAQAAVGAWAAEIAPGPDRAGNAYAQIAEKK